MYKVYEITNISEIMFPSKTACAKYLKLHQMVPQTSVKYIIEKINYAIKNNQSYNTLYFKAP